MKTLIIILLITFNVNSQIEFSLNQDFRLAILGDDKGNDAFTANILATVKLINQGTPIFVYPLFEYADLDGGVYIRYALGIGYKFKLNKLSISPSIDYGRIKRWDAVYSSFNGLIEVSYMITERVGINLLGGLTQRNDLAFRWEDKGLKENFYGGIKYIIK